MFKEFTCKYVRYYDEVEDNHSVDLFADNEEDALCLLYADLSDLYAITAEQAIVEARSQISSLLGPEWDIAKFFKNNFEIWPDNRRCFEILDVSEATQPRIESLP